MKKQNCWEFKTCKRCHHEEKEFELGVCPASVESRLNGIHEGLNAGRACWVVPNTLCGGETQNDLALKMENCISNCDFYKKVQEEEGENFEFSGNLIRKIMNLPAVKRRDI